MIVYNVRTPHAAATTFTIGAVTTQVGTVISGATRSFLILELDFQGMAAASAANELGVYRVGTAGVTPTNALTASTVEAPNMTGTTPALAFSGTAFFTYGTQPVAGGLLHPFGLNSNGQRYFWRCNPNLNNAIVVPGGNNAAGSVAVFPISGAGTGVGRIQVAEL